MDCIYRLQVRNLPENYRTGQTILMSKLVREVKITFCEVFVTDRILPKIFKNIFPNLILRRRGMKLDDEDDETWENEIEELRKLFTKALEQLAQVAGDPECKIARYWASVEADRFRSMDKARQIWSEIISKDSPAGDHAKFWIEYINLEKLFGDTKHLKRLFPR